jgi:hypothetical protein
MPFRNSINLHAFGLRGLRGRWGAATMTGLAGGRIRTAKVAIAVTVFSLGLASSAVTSQARPGKSAGGGQRRRRELQVPLPAHTDRVALSR